MANPDIPLLTRRGWIPDLPLSLGNVRLDWDDPDPEAREDTFDGAKEKLLSYLPSIPGISNPTYSDAVDKYAKPPVFFDAPSYRLLGVDRAVPDAEGGSIGLHFTMGTYFDWLNTGEVLGYEAARRYAESGGSTIVGPYREWLANPFDLARRCAIPGVNTLTIRNSNHRAIFYLHRRTGVATARDTVHLVPAGEFQPSGGSADGREVGLYLKPTIIREYAEEFLGVKDLVDPANTMSANVTEYAKVESALHGNTTCRYLGTGLYPLTWKPEILTVCVFSDSLFDDVFAKMEKETYEGHIEGVGGLRLKDDERLPRTLFTMFSRKKNRPYQGLPFDEDTVLGYANDPTTLPAARACLILAWHHRESLEIHVD
ncbi:hypothetical protein ACFWG6_35155 [Streptomyces erythrochromogenes]|uniref:hypothetical protein n=1 Tax=Streptomyces erythrochromogenes TaxID=285574 RepID=UPI0036334D01